MLGCCGDVPTLETLAAAAILRERLPELKVRVVNVVDLMRLQPESEHPHGLPDAEFDALFTADRPVVFAYHGYPWLIHRLTYRRTNHANLHVRGYKEEGTTTTPFDMVMLNDLDRFHLVMDVIDRVPGPRASAAAHLRQEMDERAARGARLHARARRGPPRRARLDLAVELSRVLVVNAGSTSLKLSRRRRRGDAAEPVGVARRGSPRDVDAVGHRVVHGGARFREPVAARRRASPTRSGAGRRSRRSTTRPALAAIDAARAALPGRAARRGLRHRLPRDDARRARRPTRCPRAGATSGASGATGSTGSPSQWAAEQVAVRRLVVCHLGGGCSVTAVLDGRSVDTTMGFRPLEGVPMATRSGTVDPGVAALRSSASTACARTSRRRAGARVGARRARRARHGARASPSSRTASPRPWRRWRRRSAGST